MDIDTTKILEQIKQSIKLLRRDFDSEITLKRIRKLDSLTQEESFWKNPEKAQKLMQERNHLKKHMDDIKVLEQEFEDATILIELGKSEADTNTLTEARRELELILVKAQKMHIAAMLSGENDQRDCYLEVHAGAGGTEAQSWADTLLRMYTRWAERKSYKIEWLEESAGEETGLKSATIKILGNNAYGWLKTESGVHRLVRISPYDSQARRHTSFSSVWVCPVVDESINIVLEEKDLKIDTYRASGAGGQHVNRTDSAIRITHIPSGIVVQCQNDRSQHRNRASAMNVLRARLYEAELQRRGDEANATEAAKSEIGWGHQIRSYVLQPYQMVKDLRTGKESSNPSAVLDGDIDAFLEASLVSSK
ncbi:peptide chain release factor 2 [Candidatus Endolissoclinum faulkneri]